ncbi:hypothetical protein EXW72_08215 [Pseudomonas sp. BCA14]|nr:hypothetical protein EXW70_04275 [Pseudomonas sp. JMN1]TFF15569.1 hypothetical protein EXW71_04765 [Pseudomonas sp. BCA17]TFF31976.1 hypothetical protein EXW72_08215 [Pseudomonas sp. BCA14]TFF32929.1 hypothetical protein EXW73_04015 [Pseudomonas sp. BCA13]
MARQEINLGTAPTGAGGDTTRSTGAKINVMTTELYARTDNLTPTAYAALVGSASGGAVFETGTNANGRYIRYADGTQICFGVVARSCAATNALGSLFYGYANSITFSAGFLEAPAFVCQSFSSGVITWDGSGGSTAGIGVPLILSTSSLAARSYTCNYMAIGKWK